MGLLDVVNGVLAGPRGQVQAQPQASSGGMSPITMALLGVLAYKALKGRAQPSDRSTAGAGTAETGGLGGVLGGLLGGGGGQSGLGGLAGGLGGLLGGASAGNMLNSGLSNLINDLKNGGLGQAAHSWVSTGPNQPVSPTELGAALGEDTVQAVSNQTGMSPSDLLAALSRHLPEVVDRLTPQGRVPTEDEAQKLAGA